MLYDTLKLSKSLRDRGFSQEQAEGLAEMLNDAAQDTLATKSDIAELRFEIVALLKAQIGHIDAQIGHLTFAMGVQTIVIIGALLAILRVGH